MSAPNIQIEDLLALAEALRGAGFAIGAQQYITAHELLDRLAAAKQLPDDPRQWRTLLGPLFCSSKREQQEFTAHFQDWLQRRPRLSQAAQEAAQRNEATETVHPDVRSSARTRQWLQLGRLYAELRARLQRPQVKVALVTVLVLASAIACLSAKTAQTLAGKVIDSETHTPITFANVIFADGMAYTNRQGEFELVYHARNFDWFWRRRTDRALASNNSYEPAVSQPVLLHQPTRQTITLKRYQHIPAPKFDLADATPTPCPNPPCDIEQVNKILWPTFVPLLLYAAWLLWRWWQRTLVAQRFRTSGTPKLRQLKLQGGGVKLFDSPAFQRALIDLRRHRHVEASDLDVAATIRATLRRGGLFTPSWGRRRALPEYLLLIERASAHDEQARVGEALAECLKASDIGVAPYYFQGDARTCRPYTFEGEARATLRPAPFAPGVTLGELAARHPEHRLLIFGDGAEFFDPFTGAAQRWLEEFAQWPERALLMAVAPRAGDYRTEVLREHEFLVLPADEAGFEVLTAWLNTGLNLEEQAEARRSAAATLPAFIAERPKRWLEAAAPPVAEIAPLLQHLKTYLGDAGWLWLRACAVYPQLAWELTLYLGARLGLGTQRFQRAGVASGRLMPQENPSASPGLTSRPHAGSAAYPGPHVEQAAAVLRLVRLPWFRYGVMPDWLRGELIARFTPPEQTRVRRVIEDLLEHVRTAAGPLEVATRPSADEDAEPRWWRRWFNAVAEPLRRWWRRRALYRWLQGQPPESRMRDYVLLSFLAGRRLRPLSVQAPRWWERLLFEDGQRALGLNAATWGLVALALAAVCYVLFYVVPMWRLPDPLPIGAPAVTPPTVNPRLFETPSPTPVPTPTPLVVDTVPGGFVVRLPNGVTLDLVNLRGDEFTMGSAKSEFDDERPVHQVRVAAFAMGKYEVTQAQWRAVMGSLPDVSFKGDNRPVESVSWNDAVKFCQRLSQLTGKQFRLPSEAEWEYAARAGTTTEYSFGDDEKLLDQYAWFGNNSGSQTHPVGTKLPNKFGLHDMHGNVWEWCQDWYSENYYAELEKQGVANNPRGPGKGQYRVLRGGSWIIQSTICRSAGRVIYGTPGNRDLNVGFRVVVSARTP